MCVRIIRNWADVRYRFEIHGDQQPGPGQPQLRVRIRPEYKSVLHQRVRRRRFSFAAQLRSRFHQVYYSINYSIRRYITRTRTRART